MTVYANFFDSGSTTKIEIDGEAVETSKAFGSDLVSAIGKMAGIVAEGVNRLPDDKRPTVVEISYALKAMNSGGYAVTVDQGNANFKIILRWESGIGGSMPTDPSTLKPTIPQR